MCDSDRLFFLALVPGGGREEVPKPRARRVQSGRGEGERSGTKRSPGLEEEDPSRVGGVLGRHPRMHGGNGWFLLDPGQPAWGGAGAELFVSGFSGLGAAGRGSLALSKPPLSETFIKSLSSLWNCRR